MYHPEDCSVIWVNNGWTHVYEFINDIPKLEKENFHIFSFELNENKYRKNLLFPMYMIGAMLLKNEQTKVAMRCSVVESKDGLNHFQLLK